MYELKAKFIIKEFLTNWRAQTVYRQGVLADGAIWARHISLSSAWDSWNIRLERMRSQNELAVGFRLRRIHDKGNQHLSRSLDAIKSGSLAGFVIPYQNEFTAPFRSMEVMILSGYDSASRFLLVWRQKTQTRVNNQAISSRFAYASTVASYIQVWRENTRTRMRDQEMSGRIAMLDRKVWLVNCFASWRFAYRQAKVVREFRRKSDWFEKRRMFLIWVSIMNISRLNSMQLKFVYRWGIMRKIITLNKWRGKLSVWPPTF